MKDTKPEIIRAARAYTMQPGRPPLKNAALLISQGVIRAVDTFDALRHETDQVTDLGEVTLAPGLINAHVHLEMTHLLGKTTQGQGFTAWIESLIAQPMYDLNPEDVARAVKEMLGAGIVHTADISTRNAVRVAGLLQGSGLFFTCFSEAIFFSPPKRKQTFIPKWKNAEGLTDGVLAAAGHALYTTHPDTLRRAKAEDRAQGLPFSLHLAEHEEEVDMLRDGSGPLPPMLEKGGIGLDNFTPPGVSPVARAGDLGLLDADTLAVHCVQLTGEDMDTLARTRTNVCCCPRSNDYIGVGRAPWEELMARGVNLCLGTDGLCSNHDLNLWNEALYVRQRMDNSRADFPLETALAWMTRNPAKALKLDRLGSLEPGKAARWCLVPKNVLNAFH